MQRPATASSGRRFPALLAALALLGTLAVAMAAPAEAREGAVVEGVESGKCLEVPEGSRAKRTPVAISDCTGWMRQRWTHTERGELKVYDDDTCLDVRARGTEPGSVLQIYPCHGGDNQRFELRDDGAIVGVGSGLCVDVLRRRTADGSPVAMWTCNDQTNQRWDTSFVDVEDTQAPTAPGDPRTDDLVCDAVTLSWDAATDDVGVTGYDLYHDGQLITRVDGDVLSQRIDLEPGTPWGLYVNARDAAGNVSQASDTVRVEPPPCEDDDEAPTTPTGLTATADGTTVTLEWDASSDDVGVRAYDVLRDGEEVGSVEDTGGEPPATTFTDSGLEGATTYAYRVRARDAQGNASPNSAPVEVTTEAECDTAVCGVREVTTDSDIPWGLVTLPNGQVLYSRRDAHDVVELDPDSGETRSVGDVPGVEGTDGEGGLLGLAVSEDFASDRWLYVMHSSATDNRVVRIPYVDGELVNDELEVLVSGIERNKFHDGGRLRFGPDGRLFVATGDAQDVGSSQELDSLNGKVLRINPDGTVPSDNPFADPDDSSRRSPVWTLGHRNPQGLAFDADGRLWQQEFGNSIDETNLLEPGANYGWPACEADEGDCDDPAFTAPKAVYSNAEASCSGIAVVGDDLWIACLRGTKVFRHQIDGTELTDRRVFFDGTYGRLRTVEPTGDGGLWLTTSNEGDKDSVPNNSDERILEVTLGG